MLLIIELKMRAGNVSYHPNDAAGPAPHPSGSSRCLNGPIELKM
jgi:hypothetical protein